MFSVQRAQTKKKKEECIIIILCKSKVSHNITELVFVFYFHSVFFFLNYNKVCSTNCNKTGLPNFLFFFFFFFQFTSSDFLAFFYNFIYFRCYPRIRHLLPQNKSIKSHACFEARSNKHYQEEKKIYRMYLQT